MTAASDDTHVLRGYSLGAVDYILSPIVPEILRTKVKVFVELFRMTAQLKRQAEERVALAEEQARRTAAEAASRRAAFLADAGKNMARSLDLETTAKATLDLAVPNLGDFAMLRLRLAGQEPSTRVIAARSPSPPSWKPSWPTALAGRAVPWADSSSPRPAAARTRSAGSSVRFSREARWWASSR